MIYIYPNDARHRDVTWRENKRERRLSPAQLAERTHILGGSQIGRSYYFMGDSIDCN